MSATQLHLFLTATDLNDHCSAKDDACCTDSQEYCYGSGTGLRKSFGNVGKFNFDIIGCSFGCLRLCRDLDLFGLAFRSLRDFNFYILRYFGSFLDLFGNLCRLGSRISCRDRSRISCRYRSRISLWCCLR